MTKIRTTLLLCTRLAIGVWNLSVSSQPNGASARGPNRDGATEPGVSNECPDPDIDSLLSAVQRAPGCFQE